MGYQSKHWSWVDDFCHKHAGFRLPCKWCIATNDVDLVYDGPFPAEDVVVKDVVSPEGIKLTSWIKPDHYDEEQAWI